MAVLNVHKAVFVEDVAFDVVARTSGGCEMTVDSNLAHVLRNSELIPGKGGCIDRGRSVSEIDGAGLRLLSLIGDDGRNPSLIRPQSFILLHHIPDSDAHKDQGQHD